MGKKKLPISNRILLISNNMSYIPEESQEEIDYFELLKKANPKYKIILIRDELPEVDDEFKKRCGLSEKESLIDACFFGKAIPACSQEKTGGALMIKTGYKVIHNKRTLPSLILSGIFNAYDYLAGREYRFNAHDEYIEKLANINNVPLVLIRDPKHERKAMTRDIGSIEKDVLAFGFNM
jgi:hypothetical protein